VRFVDLFSDPVLRGEDVHLDWDGLHLNTKGHTRIAQAVTAALSDIDWRS